jgi:hypothetical protein
MKWYKTASDHGDTLHGQRIAEERGRVSKDVSDLRDMAIDGKIGVMPRWAGEIRRRMLLLPPADRVHRMCMHELAELSTKLAGIRADLHKFEAPNHG